MDSWRWIVLPLLLIGGFGCRAGRLTEPLERENRHLEDAVYELEDQLHELEAQLDSCHRENGSLRNQLDRGARRQADDELSPPSASPPRTELGEPATGLPDVPSEAEVLEEAPPYQGPPLISPPSPERPEGVLPDGPLPEPVSPSPTDEGAQLEEPRPIASPVSTKSGADDSQVVEITLNRQLTGGHDRDNHYGDDGLMVVVEPRNGAGQIINVPGELSVVVLDPAREGPEARVARWDFKPEEATGLFKKTLLGEGIHLALPWPNQPPTATQLMLFVRYTLADGQQLIVDQPIRVKIAGTAPAGERLSEEPDQTVETDNSWEPSQRRIVSEHVPRRNDSEVRQAERPARSSRPQWAPGR